MTAQSEVGTLGLSPHLSPVQSVVEAPSWPRVAPPASWLGERIASLGAVASARLRRAATVVLLVGADVFAFVAVGMVTSTFATLADGAWLALTIAVLAQSGGYRSRLTYSLLAEAPAIIGRCVAAGALIAAVARPAWAATPTLTVQRVVMLTVFVLLLRALAYTAVRELRRRRIVEHRTLVVGAGVVGAQIATITQEHPEFGLRTVGFLDPLPLTPEQELPVPVLGDTEALGQMIRDHDVDHVIMAFMQAPESAAVDLIRTCDRLDCEIFFVPRLFELSAVHTNMDELLGMPLVRLRRATFRSVGWRLKRGVDICFAVVALLLLSLPMLAIAAVLRITMGPGVLFRQERLGLDGRSFQLLKFRTLTPASRTEAETRWTIAQDVRLTRPGKFLRRWSLDELPQLLNILRGDMSLVGPRPERPYFVAMFADSFPRYVARHRVPCGLTGWAQIHGLRGNTSIAERIRFDNHYIENWSLWLDVKILLRTVLAFRTSS